MLDRRQILTINVIGPITVLDRDGGDRTPSSRKSCALIAMLAVAPDGRRGRRWLQDHLWSDRGEKQGSASLRQSLLEIRTSFGPWRDAIRSDALVISLDLNRVKLDIDGADPSGHFRLGGEVREFLEGLDIRDPEFEDWVRDQRSYWSDYFEQLGEKMPSKRTSGGAAKGRDSPLARSEDTPDGTASAGENRIPAEARGRNSPSFSPYFGRFLNDRISVPGLPRPTAIAAVPLLNMTGRPDSDYVAEGFSEDLLNRLASLRWLPTIARSSTFGFRQSTRDLIAIADQVGARYIVDGDLISDAAELGVRVRLTNAVTGLAMWSKRYTLSRDESATTFEDILVEIVGILDTSIDLAEQQRIGVQPQHSGEFHDHIWRGRWHMNKLTRQDADLAKEHLEAALKIAPDAPEALIQLAWWHLWRIWVTRGGREEIERVKKIARRALTADAAEARAFALVGIADIWLRRHDEAVRSLRQAINLNPSLAVAHQQLGTALYLSGAPAEAFAPLQTGMRLSPNDPHLFVGFGELAMASLMVGDLSGAIDYAAHSLMHRPNYWYAHLVRINAWKRLDDREQHRRSLASFGAGGHGIADAHLAWIPFVDARWARSLREGLEPFGDPARNSQVA